MSTGPELLAQAARYLSEQPEVAAAYLYGSRAAGRAGPDSDLDIAVLFRSDMPRRERARCALRFSDELRRTTGVAVDVRELNDAPVEFKMQAIRPRRCLAERLAADRIRFEAEAISEYLDLKPALDLYYGYMTDQMRRGKVLYGARFRNRLRALGYDRVYDAHG